MKHILLFFAFILTLGTAFAQNKNEKGPRIEFKAINNTINYGVVKKGEDSGLRSFVFTNTGNAPLIINNVKSTCGCTVPDYPKTPILPGKTGKIDVKYNMNPGVINKSITVMSNAVNVNDGNVVLKITGEVKP